MGSNSPLGRFAAPIAAIASVGVIGAYLASLFVHDMDPQARTQLQDVALIALGAVFGSAVAVNGYKAPLEAAHARLDRLQTAITATAAGAGDPATVAAVGTILEDHRSGGDVPPPVAPVAPGA